MTPNNVIKTTFGTQNLEFTSQNVDCVKNAAYVVNLPVA